MTNKRNIGVRHISDARESRSRTSKVSQSKMKTKRRMIGLKLSQSPSCHTSYNCRKDFTTPKRRPRVRFNGCYSGDSPNETESPQDIIWDTNSPSQNLNGQGGGRVIEISEIVSRIAPKVKKANEGDSVLQWIGDGDIPCTPEIRQPRVRRISARQSNVEDLMKLAKQFDINMTRQDKEKKQESTEKINQVNKLQSDSKATTERSTSVKVSSEQLTSCSSQACQEEAELQALFDGPTQHISGRLSPPSVNCTPESKTEPLAPAEQKSSSAAIKSAPVDAPKTTKVDFNDDWENDDLLNDSFVLEMTQNPVPLNVAQKPSTAQPKSCSSRCNFVAKVHPSVNFCLETQKSTSKTSTFTKTLPEVKTSNQSTFRSKPPASAQNHATDKLLKTSPVHQVKQQTHSSQSTRQVQLEGMTKDCGVSSQASSAKFDGVSEEDMKSLFDSDGLWNDEADNDLLCQACDDVEMLSASQEQQRRNEEYKKLAHDKSRSFASKAPSSSAAICAQTMGINNKSQPREPTKSTRIFARSNSVPCTNSSSGLKQGYSVLPATKSSSSGLGSHSAQYYGHEQGKSGLGPRPGSVRATDTSQTVRPHSATVGNASNAHHYTFKRHLSDSMTLTNKVYISSHTTARCSAAEIERKKREAIARRRLRMQASQKNGAPT
ncbi:ewing's tumor-associated antigen 1 homolog [Sinocyclocheilus anshuiensis]|uniref:Ewing's tumor-associated antigen 1 homolog n=1 Tax=Sinocyclocheilus anshuiensis TaxID=1608454 RepID=A0A671QCU4_9TELE|nr:PREDICTED: ewing's tumor-associated antigen 1 homolog [Sinocyclocheilus anshuiensis]